MPKLTCTVNDQTYNDFMKKASSFGFKNHEYLKHLIVDNLQKPKDMLSLKQIQKSIILLIPTFVEALGRIQRADPQERKKLTKNLLTVLAGKLSQ